MYAPKIVTLTAGVVLSAWIAMSSWQPTAVQAESAWTCPLDNPLIATGCKAYQHYGLAMQAVEKGFRLLRAGDQAGSSAAFVTASTEMEDMVADNTQYVAELQAMVSLMRNQQAKQ